MSLESESVPTWFRVEGLGKVRTLRPRGLRSEAGRLSETGGRRKHGGEATDREVEAEKVRAF